MLVAVVAAAVTVAQVGAVARAVALGGKGPCVPEERHGGGRIWTVDGLMIIRPEMPSTSVVY